MKAMGFQHEALIYEGENEYLAGTIPFLRRGIEAGEPLLVIAGRERLRPLERQLGHLAGAMRFLVAEEIGANPAMLIPLWREFLDENRGRRVRGLAEADPFLRGPDACEEYHRHECLLAAAFRSEEGFSLLCPYDAAALGAAGLGRLARSHQCIERKGSRAESASFDAGSDCLAGELPCPGAVIETMSFGLQSLAEVRQRAGEVARRCGLDSLRVADFVTATSELAANSVMHGGGNGTLRLWSEGGDLFAEVDDRGRIAEPLAGRVRPEIHQEGGRGLWLANRLCELVQIRSDERGTRVRLRVPLPEEAEMETKVLGVPAGSSA
jgi:anti-sigma regulatory factor (Ser/Thr protein kinase)